MMIVLGVEAWKDWGGKRERAHWKREQGAAAWVRNWWEHPES